MLLALTREDESAAASPRRRVCKTLTGAPVEFMRLVESARFGGDGIGIPGKGRSRTHPDDPLHRRGLIRQRRGRERISHVVHRP